MSGGHFSYVNDRACEEIFGWDATPVYNMGGKEYKSGVAFARKNNPLENKMLSELTYDIFCLLHSYDWYKSADTGEDTWKKDVEFFVQKWLKISPSAVIRRTIDDCVEDLKDELIHNFGINDIEDLMWESENLSNTEKIAKLQSDITILKAETGRAFPDYRELKEALQKIDSRLKDLEGTVLWDEDYSASGTSWHRLGIQKLGLLSLYECPFCKKVIRFGAEPSSQCPVCGGDIKGYETPERIVVFGKSTRKKPAKNARLSTKVIADESN